MKGSYSKDVALNLLPLRFCNLPLGKILFSGHMKFSFFQIFKSTSFDSVSTSLPKNVYVRFPRCKAMVRSTMPATKLFWSNNFDLIPSMDPFFTTMTKLPVLFFILECGINSMSFKCL